MEGTIGVDGIFLAAHTSANSTLQALADQVASVDLQNGSDSLHLVTEAGDILDAVAYGPFDSGQVFAGETTTVVGGGLGASISRTNGAATDNNGLDFKVLQTPTPGVL